MRLLLVLLTPLPAIGMKDDAYNYGRWRERVGDGGAPLGFKKWKCGFLGQDLRGCTAAEKILGAAQNMILGEWTD